jgi:biotin carboxyl carrier protein
MRLRVGADTVSVRASRVGSEVRVTLEGEEVLLAVEPVAAGTFVLRRGDAVETFYCVRRAGVVHLWFRGVAYQIPEEREGEGTGAGQAAGGRLEAPMPGKVIRVFVREGEAVVKGQEILVVEAMKMENVLHAPQDGTVGTIRVREGDPVTPGTILVELR